MEVTPRRVLASAAARAAHVVPLVRRLDGAEPQRPAVGNRLWWQRACGDRTPRHPCHVSLGPRVWRAPTEPLEGGRGAASGHAAELGRLPWCHAQLRRLHGGGGSGGGGGCGDTWRGSECAGATPGAVPKGWREAGGWCGAGCAVEPWHAAGRGCVWPPHKMSPS